MRSCEALDWRTGVRDVTLERVLNVRGPDPPKLQEHWECLGHPIQREHQVVLSRYRKRREHHHQILATVEGYCPGIIQSVVDNSSKSEENEYHTCAFCRRAGILVTTNVFRATVAASSNQADQEVAAAPTISMSIDTPTIANLPTVIDVSDSSVRDVIRATEHVNQRM